MKPLKPVYGTAPQEQHTRMEWAVKQIKNCQAKDTNELELLKCLRICKRYLAFAIDWALTTRMLWLWE